MKDSPSLAQYLRAGLVSIPIIALAFYGGLHLGLGVTLPKLVEPFLVLSLCQMVFCCAMYWVRKPRTEASTGILERLFFVVALYATMFWLLVVYFGIKLSLLPPAEATEYYVIGLIVMPLASLFAYYVNRKLGVGVKSRKSPS